MKRLPEFVEQARPLLEETVEYEPEAVTKHLGSPELHAHVDALIAAIGGLTVFDEGAIEAAVRSTAEARGMKAGVLIHAARVAAIGRTTSPGLFEMLALLGRDETLARLEGIASFSVTRSDTAPSVGHSSHSI